jgi:hypothetical protein
MPALEVEMRNRAIAIGVMLVGLVAKQGLAEAATSTASVGYAAVVGIGAGAVVHGLDASICRTDPSGFGLALEAGLLMADSDAAGLVLAGPRFSDRHSGPVSAYLQMLAGAAIYDGSAAFVALPGAGFDVAVSGRSNLRFQAEWPIITSAGVYFGAPRLTAGFSFRLGADSSAR